METTTTPGKTIRLTIDDNPKLSGTSLMTIMLTLSLMLAATEPVEPQQGLDLWVLFGSIALFLTIVVAITLLRRWK